MMKNKAAYILDFQHVDKTSLALVGGKGANLGELARIEGIQVPEGFCLTTEVYKDLIGSSEAVTALLYQLADLKPDNRKEVSDISAQIRQVIERIPIPEGIRYEVGRHLDQLGAANAYAVRSSATAEDLPTASFAGQQDTYLNCLGNEAILTHISRCWASLFTERAILYRKQIAESTGQFDPQNVALAVVIQKMVFPQVSGVLFTADPVTGNRKVASIDASFGLGEALVAGLVNADNYKVRNGTIIDRKIAAKTLGVYPAKESGTNQQAIEPAQQNKQALTDEQIGMLERIGRTIEAHFGSPQDIEWCLDNGVFYVVQSRPITTLYPIPEANDPNRTEEGPRVYISVGHQQMMTDAMKPLGWSSWQFMANAPMRVAGGRLFVDVTPMLTSPTGRDNILNVLGKFDPLVNDALTTILERGDFIQLLPDTEPGAGKPSQRASLPDYQTLKDYEPTIVSDLVRRSQAALASLKQVIQTKSGPDVVACIREDIGALKKSIPQSLGVIMTAMNASSWINEKMEEWLGEKNVADTLAQSVENNITSEMGLALLDVADVIRPYPDVINYLKQVKANTFLEELPVLTGGQEARDAIGAYLDTYGMRCAGEIDITRPRWSEKPTILVPIILNNIKNFEPNAGKRKFDKGRQEALKKERELLERLTQLPDGEQKASQTKRMIDLVRNLSGYREYPKYDIVSHYFIHKQALLKEADRLVQAGIIQEREDIYYLTFDELGDVIRTHHLTYSIINQRKEAYRYDEKRTPPRVITSEGEIITGAYKREHLPAEAIVGLAVSSGIVEGRARVILNMEEADLEEGDILVTPFTDPSWTPMFVSIKGLVTEVGGLMTHGAVIAREYGLPAIVGVDKATKRIKDGQRIRVNGTEGYVEIL